jgi:hypothetical protein
MEHFIEIVIALANTLFGHISWLLSSLSAGDGLVFAFALVAMPVNNISEGSLTNVRRWRGGIADKFTAIDNLLSTILANQPAWAIQPELLEKLKSYHKELEKLVHLCKTSNSSMAHRAQRDALLSTIMRFCRIQIRAWAYQSFASGLLTASDVHLLGFLLPGENGGYHRRSKATAEQAYIKVGIINEDFIRVSITHTTDDGGVPENQAWPSHIPFARIVITASDGQTEVYNNLTTHIHNDIHMPKGSHGKQFVAKASFLKHVDDKPVFGNQQVFSIPLNTEDLLAAAKNPQAPDSNFYLQEIEHLKEEIEKLKNELSTRN